VLVTGATGFVGRTLCGALADAGYHVRAALRSPGPVPRGVKETAITGAIDSSTDWSDALAGTDAVIHAAARAHVLNDSPNNRELYMEVNARGTARLARAARACGIGRFVFLSSIKVNGESTTDEPFRATDAPHPQDAYGASKLRAEQELQDIEGLDTVIVRPPLVYGPGVKANFLRLLQWADRERPLPIAAVRNRRSLVSSWNLCDLLVNTVDNPAAPGRVWLVSDGDDLSTPDLACRMAAALSRRSRLFAVPVPALRAIGALTGRSAEVMRLCGSLVVDCTPTRAELAWQPPVSVDEALSRTAQWYRSSSNAVGVV